MDTTAKRGALTEAAVLHTFARAGLAVLVPWQDDLPYDLVVDLEDGRFVRVQCKTARVAGNIIKFNCCSTDHGRGRIDYRGRADVFGVYEPVSDRVLIVPVERAPRFVMSLRLSPAANNQRMRVWDAEHFDAERWIESLATPAISACAGT